MKRGLLLGGFILLGITLLVPLVLAINTEIKIKTMPFHNVKITILEHTESELEFKSLGYLSSKADEYGDVKFNYDATVSSFDLGVEIKRNDERVLFEKFREDYPAGEPIYLEVVTAGFEIIPTPGELNESEVNETNLTEEVSVNTTESEEESTELTGQAVDTGGSGDSKNLIFYLIGAFILLIVFFVVSRIVKYGKVSGIAKDEKDFEDKSGDYKEMIEDAQKKINEAQQEIKELKKREDQDEKINKVREKLLKDQRELTRLKSEGDQERTKLREQEDRELAKLKEKEDQRSPDKSEESREER